MTKLVNVKTDSLISETTLEDLFCCSICFNQFDEFEYLPKLLSCHHTFCRKCLSILYEQNNKLKCPVCSEESLIGRKGVDSLSTNYYLYKFTEMLNSLKLDQEIPSSTESSSDETCKKHGNTIKYFWCITCSEKVCVHCLGIDHSLANKHNVKNIDEAIKIIQKDVLINIKNVKDKISKIKKLKQKSEMTNANMIKAIATLKNMYEIPFKCFHDIFTDSQCNPEKILASVNEFSCSEKFKCNLESLVTMECHLKEVLTYYCSIEDFLEQKVKEMELLQKSRIFLSVIRPEIQFDYGRIYCIRCGELCCQPQTINIETDNSCKEKYTKNFCKNCNIVIMEFP